ncbi:MAG: winged helix-turn-helix transcriptional regulator, partial [Candidatus Lokiarchaeota archaeon]|nr:winged helix-turn-helix transcriptional regulator [Candidatus Lokiarchaeota archaeon]
SIDQLYLNTYSWGYDYNVYYDAIGYSWDPNYNVGDNLYDKTAMQDSERLSLMLINFYINLIISIFSLGLVIVFLYLDKGSTKESEKLRRKATIHFSTITLSTFLLSFQIVQIQNNTKLDIQHIAHNSLIFFYPYIIFILSILVLILISLSIVLSLQEYKSYIETRKKELVSHRKLKFKKIFENENRQKIVTKILENPGIHFRELLRKCQLQRGQLQWHINILQEFGIIKKKRIGQYTSYFPCFNSVNPRSYDRILSKSKIRLDIVDLTQKIPGITPTTISERLKLNLTTIDYHIKKLERNNIIRTAKEGREVHLFLNEKITLEN